MHLTHNHETVYEVEQYRLPVTQKFKLFTVSQREQCTQYCQCDAHYVPVGN